MKEFILKIYNQLPLKELRDFYNRLVPLYIQYRYRLKLSFFSLPLLVHWIYPLTFEKDEKTILTARRSMSLAILYLLISFLLYFLKNLISDLFFIRGVYSALILYILQTLITLGYFGYSLYTAYLAFQEVIIFPEKLKVLTDEFEKVISQ